MSTWTRPCIVVALAALFTAGHAPAAQQRTGSHLDSRTARPTAVYINKPSAIDEILRLIQANRRQDAVELAREHVESLRTRQVIDETLEPANLYFALNALCVALTTIEAIEEALVICDEAIDEAPRQWTAWNSRGTTHYANFTYEAAIDDFERALALAPNNAAIIDTIQWNIRLARERLMEITPGP